MVEFYCPCCFRELTGYLVKIKNILEVDKSLDKGMFKDMDAEEISRLCDSITNYYHFRVKLKSYIHSFNERIKKEIRKEVENEIFNKYKELGNTKDTYTLLKKEIEEEVARRTKNLERFEFPDREIRCLAEDMEYVIGFID